jgi:hypothetical protein
MAAIRPSKLTKNHGEIGGDTTIIDCTVVIASGFSVFSLFKLSYIQIYLNARATIKMTTQNTRYQNGKQQPAIILILCRSNHCHHTFLTSMSTHPESPATVIRTTSDVNFKQTQHIYAIAAWITDAIGILEELWSAISERTSSRKKLLEKASFVKKFVIPLFLDATITITSAAKNLSPISGSKYVHQRNETKRKQENEVSNNTTLTPGEEMIVRYVKAIKHNNKMVDVTPAAKQHRRSTACVSPTDTFDIITLPAPTSGKTFNKIEVVNLMSKVPVGHICAATANAIMKHQKQYNV